MPRYSVPVRYSNSAAMGHGAALCNVVTVEVEAATPNEAQQKAIISAYDQYENVNHARPCGPVKIGD